MDLTRLYIFSLLPKRPKDAHKGIFGKVLVVAGSENYPGAAYLTCAASYRVGAGLITLVTSREVKTIVSKKLPEVTFLSYDEIFKKLNDYDVLILGPGLGQKEKTIELVKELIGRKLPKTIIDGDGLNILSKLEKWWEELNGEVVLTPHPGEMSRLSGLSINKIQSARENIAKEFAKKWNKIIVLKGAKTLIAAPSGKVIVAPFANPLLATAGTGDVLSGMIGGFIAQGLNLFNAATCGVYIHGLVGEQLTKKYGKAGALASDLLPLLPQYIKELI